MFSRYALGAVVGYWKTNCGSAWALKYYEQFLLKDAKGLHVQEVVELCQAFRWNRTHHRDHLRSMLHNHFKEPIVAKWRAEVEYNQRVLYNLMVEFEHINYEDEEIHKLMFTTICRKKRINNLTFFSYFHKRMV
jgi:hypothetical protein